jgi:hypothetical protein
MLTSALHICVLPALFSAASLYLYTSAPINTILTSSLTRIFINSYSNNDVALERRQEQQGEIKTSLHIQGKAKTTRNEKRHILQIYDGLVRIKKPLD